MYLAPKVVLSSSSEMHNEHREGCAITLQLIYGPPWCQGGWSWETASEYKSWKAWAAPFCWTCHVESTPEAGTGPQEGLISFLGPGLNICSGLLNSCGAWRGRSFRRVPPSFKLSEHMKKKKMLPVKAQVFPQTWLREQHLLGLHGNGSDHCSGVPRGSGGTCPWTSLPSPPGMGMWCCGGEKAPQMSTASCGGRTHSGWETAFSGFTSASQKFRKKKSSFQILAKE